MELIGQKAFYRPANEKELSISLMQSKKWLKFLEDIIPDKKTRENLQKVLGMKLSGGAFMPRNLHGTFDQPCKDARGLAAKVVK